MFFQFLLWSILEYYIFDLYTKVWIREFDLQFLFFHPKESCTLFEILIFLGVAPTSIYQFFRPSICQSVHRALYLRKHTSSYLNFWCTCVKWYIQGFFTFLKVWFFGLLEGKRAKNSPKWKIIISVMHHISGTVSHMMIFGTLV